MKKHFIFLLFLIYFAYTPSTYALAGFYFDAFTSVGYSSPEPIGAGANPTLLQTSLGATGAMYIIPILFAGLTTDYRVVTQYSDPATTGGNYRGTRFNYLAPVIGLKIPYFIFKLDLQFLGNYDLSNAANYGAKISFTKPFGIRITGLYEMTDLVFANLCIGGFLESVSYGGQSNSVTGDSTLDSRFRIGQIAAVAAITF